MVYGFTNRSMVLGFTSEENPSPSRKEVKEILRKRQGTYNRYPKDAFGVYASSWDKGLDKSVTKEPSDCPGDTHSVKSLPGN